MWSLPSYHGDPFTARLSTWSPDSSTICLYAGLGPAPLHDPIPRCLTSTEPLAKCWRPPWINMDFALSKKHNIFYSLFSKLLQDSLSLDYPHLTILKRQNLGLYAEEALFVTLLDGPLHGLHGALVFDSPSGREMFTPFHFIWLQELSDLALTLREPVWSWRVAAALERTLFMVVTSSLYLFLGNPFFVDET